MSTQVQLYERSDEMTDEMLLSEGYMSSGVASMMDQLASPDYFDEMMDALIEAENVIVGNDVRDNNAQEISQVFNGVETVTENHVGEIEELVSESQDINEDVVNFVEKRIGEEMFAVHM